MTTLTVSPGITRFDFEKRKGYMVRIKRGKKRHNIWIPDKKFGGKRKALLAAKQSMRSSLKSSGLHNLLPKIGLLRVILLVTLECTWTGATMLVGTRTTRPILPRGLLKMDPDQRFAFPRRSMESGRPSNSPVSLVNTSLRIEMQSWPSLKSVRGNPEAETPRNKLARHGALLRVAVETD